MAGLSAARPAAVIVLADWRSVSSELTVADRHALRRWSSVERPVSFCIGEAGPYALLYDRSPVWASWGMARFRRRVSLWNCITLDDVGVFASALEALEALEALAGGLPDPAMAVVSALGPRGNRPAISTMGRVTAGVVPAR